MTQIDDKALEAAVLAHDKEEAAMRGEPDPWADERPEDEFADRKAAMAEAIRAYLSASDAEREPVAFRALWPVKAEGVELWAYDDDRDRLRETMDGKADIAPLYAAPLPLTDLEAENARLRERLDEALNALEPFAKVAPVFDHQRIPAPCEDHHTVYKWATNGTGEVEIMVADFRAARRVREGGE